MEKLVTGACGIEEYLQRLSSKAPVPGGGGASALAGALGEALGQMVVSLTVGKKRYLQAEEELRQIGGRLEALQAEFLRLADRDAEVFAPLAACYGLPADTPEQRRQKEERMEGCLLEASLAPLAVMERAVELLSLLEVLARKGSRLAVSDAGVAAQFARTAVLGAVMNVYINTKSMKDRGKAEELNARAGELAARGAALADSVYGEVLAALR